MDIVTNTMTFKAKKEREYHIKDVFLKACKKYNVKYSYSSETVGIFKNKIIVELKMTGEEKMVQKARREFDIWTSGNTTLQLLSLL